LLIYLYLSSGEGVAYITDSSTEGRNGIIVVDLGTGQSWRHLDAHPSTLPDEGFIASYNGEPFLPIYAVNGIRQQWLIGADGIAISPDGEWLYYTPLAARTWYRVPTALLRVPSSGPGSTPTAAWQARRSVEFLGRLPSHADGFESDTNGLVYLTAPETNSIYTWDPKDGQLSLLVRDELIQWADTLSVANDGRIYFTVNTAWL
jgi:sugar lactone lactonase YvrE